MAGFPLLLAVMAGAAIFCRFGGYLAMRYLPVTPRLEAALRATPAAVMGAIGAIAVANGGAIEALALAAAVVLTLVIGQDAVGALLAVALAAVARLFWP